MKKKSIVGYTQRNPIKRLKFVKSEPYYYLFIPTVFRGKSHFKHLCMGEHIKVRITIQEIK